MTIGNFLHDTATSLSVFNASSSFPWASYMVDNIQVFTLLDYKPAGNDTTICRFQNIILGPKEVDSCNYSWSPTSGLSNDTIPNPQASPDTTTTYILTISGCGVTVSDSVTVFVQQCELAGNDTTICKNTFLQIGPIYVDTCQYNWFPSSGLSSDTIPNPLASPDSTTTYFLTISGCGTTVSDSVTITVEECEPWATYEIAIFPNNDGNFTVYYNHPEGEQLKIFIFNSLGQKCIELSLENGTKQKDEIILNQFSQGYYYASIVEGTNKIFGQKLVIIK